MDLKIDITYKIEDGNFEIKGNVKEEAQVSIIENFLRTQKGNGQDNREANNQEKYHISLELDLTDDSYKVSYDTGNKGLRDGILIDVLGRL